MDFQWEIVEAEDGTMQLYNAKHDTTFEAVLNNTRRAVVEKGLDLPYDSSEHAALLGIRDRLVSGEASAAVNFVSHPEGTRYVSLFERNGTTVTSTQVDVAKIAGRNLHEHEVEHMVDRIRARHQVLEDSDAKYSEHPHVVLQDSTPSHTELAAIVVGQTYHSEAPIQEESGVGHERIVSERMNEGAIEEIESSNALLDETVDTRVQLYKEGETVGDHVTRKHEMEQLIQTVSVSEIPRNNTQEEQEETSILGRVSEAGRRVETQVQAIRESITENVEGVKTYLETRSGLLVEAVTLPFVMAQESVGNIKTRVTDAIETVRDDVRDGIQTVRRNIARVVDVPVMHPIATFIQKGKEKVVPVVEKGWQAFTRAQQFTKNVGEHARQFVSSIADSGTSLIARVFRRKDDGEEPKKLEEVDKETGQKQYKNQLIEAIVSLSRHVQEHRDEGIEPSLEDNAAGDVVDEEGEREWRTKTREQKRAVEVQHVRAFAFGWALIMLYDVLRRGETTNLSSEKTSLHQDLLEQGEAIQGHKSEPTPWILFAIIWHLAMIRESGKRSGGKQSSTTRRIKPQPLQQQGVIYAYVS